MDENPNRRQDESERAPSERATRHDKKQANRRPARSHKPIIRSHIPRPGGGGLIEASKQERTRNEGVGRKGKKSPEPSPRNDEAAYADSGIEHEQARANRGTRPRDMGTRASTSEQRSEKKYRPVYLHEERGDIKS